MSPVTSSLLLLILFYVGSTAVASSAAEKCGSCPIPSTKCRSPPPKGECDSDADCSGDLKCCIPKCTPTCTKPSPDKGKPGTCPVVMTLVACATPAPKPLCNCDQDCQKDEKCCMNGCQIMCVTPVSK